MNGQKTISAETSIEMGLRRHTDLIIANLTPFHGVSADPDTVFELG